MERYRRVPLEVTAAKYELNQGMEDGFRLYSQIVTSEGIVTDGMVKSEREDGTIVCPYVRNRRGLVFIRKGDYIICEADENGRVEKHVCGEDKFHRRFEKL